MGGFPTCISFGEQTQKRVGWRAPAKIGHGLRVLFYDVLWFCGRSSLVTSVFVSRTGDSHISRIALVCHGVSLCIRICEMM